MATRLGMSRVDDDLKKRVDDIDTIATEALGVANEAKKAAADLKAEGITYTELWQ